MGKVYSPLTVARYFLEKEDCTHLKLQKLVYFAYSWHMVAYGKPPLVYEHPEAWKYGPVFPELYLDLCSHRGHKISIGKVENKYHDTIDEDHPRAKRLLDAVWSWYGSKTGIELSALSHQKNTPWDITGSYYGPILDAGIMAYFKQDRYKDMLDYLKNENNTP